MLPPNKLASTTAPNWVGFLYVISKTEESLSPNFAWNPPAEKSTF